MRRRTKRSRKQESTDEDDEVTRCVCGTTESNSNIMIQCESCSVWQHCDCMNLSAKKLPKNYWCEECRPDNHPYYQLFQPKPAANKRPSLGDSFWDLERVSKQPKKRGTLNSRVADLFDMSDMSLFNEQSDSVKDKESEIETPLLGKSQLDKVKDMDAEEEGSIDIEGSEKDKEENHDLKNEEETNASEDLGEDETNGGSVDDVENSNSQTSERTVKKNARRRDTANNSLPPKKRGRKNVNSNGSTSRLSGNTGKKINVEDSQTQNEEPQEEESNSEEMVVKRRYRKKKDKDEKFSVVQKKVQCMIEYLEQYMDDIEESDDKSTEVVNWNIESLSVEDMELNELRDKVYQDLLQFQRHYESMLV